MMGDSVPVFRPLNPRGPPDGYHTGIGGGLVNPVKFLAKLAWDADFKRLYPDLE